MEVSIIVRFKNEEKYLSHVLNALRQQKFYFGSYEIIGVDNNSTDKSLQISEKLADQTIKIEDYHPGQALNRAIEVCRGEKIAILSAHTIPANDQWLNNLYKSSLKEDLLGVYGAQLYPINSKFLDKRDLDIFSTRTPRNENVDSDFWNANSILSKSMWKKKPFNEEVFELEDHYWTKQLLQGDLYIYFEPKALVYHYSHIERLDREHLDKSTFVESNLIENAIAELRDSHSSWPQIMKAGLILSSLTHNKDIVKAVPVLGKTLVEHSDFDVRWRMAQALGKIPTEASVDYLIKALDDSSFYPRDEAAWSLAKLGRISAPLLIQKHSDLSKDALPFVALALGRSGIKSAEKLAVDILYSELSSGNWEQRRNAAYFAGEITSTYGSERLIHLLNELLLRSPKEKRHVFCWALGCYSKKAPSLVSWDNIFNILNSNENTLARFEAIAAIGKYAKSCGEKKAIHRIINALSDPEDRVRYGAIQSLRLFIECRNEFINIESFLPNFDRDFGVKFEKSLIMRMHG